MMKRRQKINLLQPQQNRNGTGFFVNLIMTSTVSWFVVMHLYTWLFLEYVFKVQTLTLPIPIVYLNGLSDRQSFYAVSIYCTLTR